MPVTRINLPASYVAAYWVRRRLPCRRVCLCVYVPREWDLIQIFIAKREKSLAQQCAAAHRLPIQRNNRQRASSRMHHQRPFERRDALLLLFLSTPKRICERVAALPTFEKPTARYSLELATRFGLSRAPARVVGVA